MDKILKMLMDYSVLVTLFLEYIPPHTLFMKLNSSKIIPHHPGKLYPLTLDFYFNLIASKSNAGIIKLHLIINISEKLIMST